ncbi:MAG: hypothetical protein VXX28_00775, partial [Verrucomicrobiota bacterium]|nr:hypothetical protein [Verrucomicrobiota bacterium]
MGAAGRAGVPANRPMVGVGKDGNPWVAYRYFNSALWRIAVTSFRQENNTWSSRRRLPSSSFGQDSSVSFVPPHGKGDIRICWPSDERIHKAHQTAAIMLASLPSAKLLPEA